MSRPRIYVSGPITKGNRNQHFYRAAEAERELMLAGFAPLNPMRSITLPFAWQTDMPHALWLECDLAWIEVCDAVLRLSGDSKGGDEECEFAKAKDIPVFYMPEDYPTGECFGTDLVAAIGKLKSWRAAECVR